MSKRPTTQLSFCLLPILVLGFFCAGMLGCNSSDEPKQAELTPEEIESQSVEIEKTFETIDVLEKRFDFVSAAQRIDDCNSRVRMVDRLLQLVLSDDERRRAILTQLDALSKLHATREINSSERFREEVKRYIEDRDRDVQRAAKMGLVSIRFVDLIRTSKGKFEPLEKAVKSVLKNYPHDEQVALQLDALAINLFGMGRKTEGNKVTSLMLSEFQKTKNEKIKNYLVVLRDRLALDSVEFNDKLMALRSQEVVDKNTFLRAVQKLASNSKLGDTVLDELLKSCRWLEQNNQYIVAAEVYNIIGQKISDHPNSAIAERAKVESASGFSRLEMIGRSVEIKGSTVLGDEVTSKDYEGKVVLLFFWSSTNPTSVNAMGKLFEYYQNYSRDEFDIIAISTDDNAKDPIKVLGTQVPPWTILIPGAEKDNDNNLAVQCSVTYVPFAVLIDRSGKISEINVSIGKMDSGIRRLLREKISTTDSVDAHEKMAHPHN